jgi:hypothetical protein
MSDCTEDTASSASITERRRDAERKRRTRAQATPAERERARQQDAARKRKARQQESNAQRQERRKRNAECERWRREKESRAARTERLKCKQEQQRRRQAESAEARRRRLEKEAWRLAGTMGNSDYNRQLQADCEDVIAAGQPLGYDVPNSVEQAESVLKDLKAWFEDK